MIKARKKEKEIVEEESLEELEKEVIETVNPKTEIKKEKKAPKKNPEEHSEKVKEPKKHHAKAEKENAQKKEPKEAKEKALKEKPVKEKNTKEKPAKEKPVKEKPAKQTEILTDPEEIKKVEESAKEFLTQVFAAMELEVEIKSKYNPEDGCLEAEFLGDDMGILIGKRGQTLDSLQYLTSLVVNKGRQGYIRVKLDTEDYRRRRKETLENLARGIAYKVKKTRKPVVLEPMNPYERRIIHSALQGNRYVETISEGEEPYRHVVVKLKRDKDR